MKTFALSTGSSGNCYFIENNKGEKILVDFGISYKKAKKILEERGVSIEDIKGIFITHEHTDHIKGIKTLLKKHKCKVYTTEKTGTLLGIDFHPIRANSRIFFGNFTIYAVSKPHDAVDPVSYLIESNNKKIGIFTDLGYITPIIKDLAINSNVLYLEANYCTSLISEKGMRYISRCISNYGHLSTEESLSLVANYLRDSQLVIFSHISENNNDYDYIRASFNEIIKKTNKKIKGLISYQGEPTPLINIREF